MEDRFWEELWEVVVCIEIHWDPAVSSITLSKARTCFQIDTKHDELLPESLPVTCCCPLHLFLLYTHSPRDLQRGINHDPLPMVIIISLVFCHHDILLPLLGLFFLIIINRSLLRRTLL